MVAPLLVGLVAIPLLIDGMGKERFGLLTIIWMGVGYLSLFDMGLGRALTKLVAERLGDGREDDLSLLIWTALGLVLLLGVAGGASLFLVSGYLVHYVLNVPAILQQEAVTAFRVLAVGLPFVVVTAALRGLLEAHQRFGVIMAIRIPLGALTFLGPLAALQFSPSLAWATVAMLGTRVAGSGVYFWAAASCQKELFAPKLPCKGYVRPLLHFGGWLTVTKVIGPLLVYFDRFLLGTIMSMTAVTYYVTPYEVLQRLQVLPGAIMGVLFPAMSTAHAVDRTRLEHLYERTSRVLLVLMLPVAGFFFLFAPEALGLWLGPDFRQQSTPVVQWLALGLLVNVLAKSPLVALQTGGRPDVVAKTHAAELVPYALVLWFMTNQFGIAGTAATWFLRVLVDTLILNELARRLMSDLGQVVRRTYGELIAVLLGAAAVWPVTSLSGRALIFLGISVLAALPALRVGEELVGRRSPEFETES
jgi:O-antigen/teichoic acid export membrane protein